MIAITESDNSNAGFVIMVVYTCFVSISSLKKIKINQIPVYGVPSIEGEEDVYYYKGLPALTITDKFVEHAAFLGVLLPNTIQVEKSNFLLRNTGVALIRLMFGGETTISHTEKSGVIYTSNLEECSKISIGLVVYAVYEHHYVRLGTCTDYTQYKQVESWRVSLQPPHVIKTKIN